MAPIQNCFKRICLKSKYPNRAFSSITGPYSLNNTNWAGCFGDVVTGKYHVSISNWVYNKERNSVLDIVSAYTERLLCLMIPNPPEFDPGLLYRPLTENVWYVIFIILILGCCLVSIPHLFHNGYDESTSKQIVMITLWSFFILINAYYSGALTMFFVAETTVPFNSVRDILRSFPTWKLLMHSAHDIYYKQPAIEVRIF